MIICDTSGLYAAYNARQPGHSQVLAAVGKAPGPLVVSQYVLTELDYLLRTRVSVEAEVGMLGDVQAGAYDTAEVTAAELASTISLIERHANRNLGIAGSRTSHLLTLDQRDYRVVRPLWGEAFTLLPADSP